MVFCALICYHAGMARRSPKKRQKNLSFPHCKDIKVTVLDDDMFAITFLTEDAKKKQSELEPVLLDKKSLLSFTDALNEIGRAHV